MGTSNSLQYLIWLNSKAVKIYSIVQIVNLLLALSIHETSNLSYNHEDLDKRMVLHA